MKHDNRYASAGILTYALEMSDAGLTFMIPWDGSVYIPGHLMQASGASDDDVCHEVRVWNSTGIADPSDRSAYSNRHFVGTIDMRQHAALHTATSAKPMIEGFVRAMNLLIAEYESGGA